MDGVAQYKESCIEIVLKNITSSIWGWHKVYALAVLMDVERDLNNEFLCDIIGLCPVASFEICQLRVRKVECAIMRYNLRIDWVKI